MTDAVPGFDVTSFTHGGRTHEVYRAGAGSAVVVVHEMPGLHPGVTKFGQRLVDAGFRVYLPSLFGRPGAPFGGSEMRRTLRQVCVSREFHLLADRTPPVVTWLRALAAEAHTECGGPGVGAVGMCFTGGYALAMAVEPAVLAPVLSQPGIPAPVTARKRAALGLDPADLASVKARTSDGLCVLGLRFSRDKGSRRSGSPRCAPNSARTSRPSRSTRRRGTRTAYPSARTRCSPGTSSTRPVTRPGPRSTG